MTTRVVALLGRACGLRVLHEALLADASLRIATVFTHGLRPRAEGGGVRPELEAYRACCGEARIPLVVLDGAQAGRLDAHMPQAVDLVVAVSWRNLVSQEILHRPRLGAMNLHRGALPAYAGAEPVRRAIEAGERHVAITAHRMTAEIDAGDEIARVRLPTPPRPRDVSASEHAETVKAGLEPLYAPLARLAIAALIADGPVA